MERKKVFKVIKDIGTVVISIGVGSLATNIIKTTTTKSTSPVVRACTLIGTFVISGLFAGRASKEFEESIDKVEETIEKNIEDLNKTNNEEVVEGEA